MGRHSSLSPLDAHPPRRGRSTAQVWAGRVTVGLVACVATVLASRLTGATWWTSALIGLVAAFVVPIAAWAAGFTPDAPHDEEA